MRRYRNARYAPESLERKLSPSGLGLSAASVPAPAQYGTMSAYATPSPTYYSNSPSNLGLSAASVPAPAQYGTMSAYATPSPTYYSNSSSNDTLYGDDQIPPNPDGGTAPTIPPETPTGPVLPG